jgi:hypothetical protein
MQPASRVVERIKMKSRRIAVIALALALLASPVVAKNFAVPDKDPAIIVSIPNDWATKEVKYGYEGWSPNKDVYISVEFAAIKNVKAMMEANQKWMKDTGIKVNQPIEAETNLNGITATLYKFETTYKDAPTTVDFIMLPGGKDRVVLLTLWGNDEERTKHGKAIDSILSSVKAIN